ncbi:MAG: hypothetical protein IID61_10985 [SAR324 cluster bacterium]|nr:hypothetical protein [SAR324 cluster bacterium]
MVAASKIRAIACDGPRRWLLLAVVVLVASCAPHREIYPRLNSLAASGQYDEAVRYIESEKDKYGERNDVLYNLDRGVFYHYAGKYKESNEAFELAEVRMDELFTESISGNVAAFLSNDNTLPYGGEDFEQVVVNMYRALNYVQLGDVDAALVEARKVDNKLDYINRQYEPDQQNVYKEDAFARMLMGIFYEMAATRDDLNDAYISNRRAVAVYEKDFVPQYQTRAPDLLKANLLTTAAFMGSEEFSLALEKFPGTQSRGLGEKRELGQLYFVHFAGRGPEKYESSINAIMPDGNLLRIAFPGYFRNTYLITGAQVRVDGSVEARLEPGAPIGEMAIKNLDNRKGRIAAKAIARATTKYIASRLLQRKAQDDAGPIGGLIAWVAGNVYIALSEQADLRSWQTLPDKILIGRVLLKPGSHHVVVEFVTSGGGVVSSKDLGQIDIPPGTTRFIVLHSNT